MRQQEEDELVSVEGGDDDNGTEDMAFSNFFHLKMRLIETNSDGLHCNGEKILITFL